MAAAGVAATSSAAVVANPAINFLIRSLLFPCVRLQPRDYSDRVPCDWACRLPPDPQHQLFSVRFLRGAGGLRAESTTTTVGGPRRAGVLMAATACLACIAGGTAAIQLLGAGTPVDHAYTAAPSRCVDAWNGDVSARGLG